MGSNLVEEGSLIEGSMLVRRNNNFFYILSVVVRLLSRVGEFKGFYVVEN